MKRRVAMAAVLVSATACYTPRGAFVAVDDLPLSSVGDYTVGPGDVLMVRVFEQEAMSARVRVRNDGKVSLPMVNDLVAAGKTPEVLAAELQVRLRGFINNPVVTVSLEEARPLTVSVIGEVMRAGIVTLEPGAGVLQALAAAGGLTDFAHRDGLFVVRKGPGDPAPKRVRLTWEALTRVEGRACRFLLVAGDVVIAE